jgi:hypothetical protein
VGKVVLRKSTFTCPYHDWTNRLDVALPARTFSGAKRVPRVVSINQTVFLRNWALTGAAKAINTVIKGHGITLNRRALFRRRSNAPLESLFYDT